jgi:pimeloyl-ACP methyl ester carboxylesterase
VTVTSREATNAGVRLAYELRGSGEPVLLVHGLGYARWGWEPVAPPLAEDFLVVLFDNRGIGESDVPAGPYAVAELARDACAVLDAAGIERAHVVGTSLGGMVAQELALSHPERVERLVLACTTPGGARAHPMPARTVALMLEAPTLPLERALRRFVENALSPRTVSERPELVERIYGFRLASPLDPDGWQAQAAAGASFDRLARLGEIRAPTLVVTGTDDNVVDPRNSDLLAQRIPDARLERVPDSGHLFFWEQPERFHELVREFLQ